MVPKSKRKKSKKQYLMSAREINMEVIRLCCSFPKKYEYYLCTPIADTSARIYENVRKADSINPKNRHELELRTDFLIFAKGEVNYLISQLEMMNEFERISPSRMEKLMSEVSKELESLEEIIKEDKVRYKNYLSDIG